MRAILLIAWAGLFFPIGASADDIPKLPSRKVSVVIPLLERFFSKEVTQKDALAEIGRVLGEADFGTAGGTPTDSWKNDYFDLDDKTQIDVGSLKDKLSISVRMPDKGIKILYPKPRA